MRRTALFLLVAGDVAALAALPPEPGTVVATLRHPHAVLAQRGADGALLPVAGALTWAVAAWLGVGLLAALVARLPGRPGHLGEVVARRLLPQALRAVVTGSAGLGVLLAPVAALAQDAPAGPPAAAALPSPAWPVATPGDTPPLWPTSTAPTPRSPTPTPPAPPNTASPAPPVPSHPTAGADVTVRPGDSLWSIAAEHLDGPRSPQRVAAAWPRWFAANRAAIGDDPDLLRPGVRLHPPVAHPASPSSRQEGRP